MQQSRHPRFRALAFPFLVAAGCFGAACAVANEAAAQSASARANIHSQDIELADYAGGDLPQGQSALTARVQILLDRSGVSPGVVDGFKGGMSQSAILAFERGHGLTQDGIMDPDIWSLLQAYADAPMTTDYTIVDADGEGLVAEIPADYAEKAAMTSQGYTSILEKLSERFHMDDRFLAQLNPGAQFVPGETIRVTLPAKPIKAKVTRIIIDKETSRVAAYDAGGRMVADYPATVGSSDTPSPHGIHKVTAVALDPNYTYNPNKNFKQGNNDKVLIVPPGPNAPVGNVWIDLSEPTYGLHGTPSPSRLFVQQSHGCVRMTNWDARELAHMVQPGVTEVEFLSPGVRISDVAAGAMLASSRPPVPSAMRPAGGLALPGTAIATGSTDAAVAQAIAGGPAASLTLVASQRPGANPLRGAGAATAAPDAAAVATSAPLPGEADPMSGPEAMPLPGNVASDQGSPFELAPLDPSSVAQVDQTGGQAAPQGGVQPAPAAQVVPAPWTGGQPGAAPQPAAQPATQPAAQPQLAPGQLVVDPFATPVQPQPGQVQQPTVAPVPADPAVVPPAMSDG